MARCKPCANPYDADDIPRHLPAGLAQYVLHAFATKSPPYHVTTDDVSTPPVLIDVAKITGHQCVRVRGGAIAVLYETHWNGILRLTWERELDLQAFRHLILAYWANDPDHHQPNTRQYQELRINAAAREIARAKGERHLPGSYRLVTNDVYRARFLSAPLPTGASIWYHSFDGSWWLGKIKQPSNVLERYVVRFLDNLGPALIDLPESAYNTMLHAPCGSWCLQTHGRTNPLEGVLHTPRFTPPSAVVITTADILPETKTIMSASKTSTSETKTIMSTPKPRTPETKAIISTPKTSISTPETIMSPTRFDIFSSEPFGKFELRRFCSLSLCQIFAVSTHVVLPRRTRSSVYCKRKP